MCICKRLVISQLQKLIMQNINKGPLTCTLLSSSETVAVLAVCHKAEHLMTCLRILSFLPPPPYTRRPGRSYVCWIPGKFFLVSEPTVCKVLLSMMRKVVILILVNRERLSCISHCTQMKIINFAKARFNTCQFYKRAMKQFFSKVFFSFSEIDMGRND